MVQIIKSNWWWGSWWGGGGEWDMKRSVYDPNNVGKNVYDYDNFIHTPEIPTKTSDLTNDSNFVDSSTLSTALSSKQNTLTAGSGIEITNDVISATWGWGEWNTKTFYLSSVGTGDLTTAQAVVDWYLAGKNPIIVYTNKAFVVDSYFWSSLSFKCFTFSFSNSNPSYNEQSYTITTIRTMDITINESTWTATRVNYSSSQTMGKGYLAPWVNYSTPYLPEYDGSPATKKYVDNSVKTYYPWEWINIVSWWWDLLWWYIPSIWEIDLLSAILLDGGVTSPDAQAALLKLPKCWRRSPSWSPSWLTWWSYWTSTNDFDNVWYAYYIAMNTSSPLYTDTAKKSVACPIRLFKSFVVKPTYYDKELWEELLTINWQTYSWKIYRNREKWLITFDIKDGSIYDLSFTIADKNVWATEVWNNWDVLTPQNCWNVFQWGNSYWFPSAINENAVFNTSSTQVDTSDYWWMSDIYHNYSWKSYFWDTFITWNDDRSSTDNVYLWANNKIWIHPENTINNTIEESNTKTFYLYGTSDLDTAQEVYDWYNAGKNPIIVDQTYWTCICAWNLGNSNYLFFVPSWALAWTSWNRYTTVYALLIRFTITNWNVTAITQTSFGIAWMSYLEPWVDYTTPYTPEYDGSPTTKKYVDDKMTKNATTPSNPVEWMIWYDSTNKTLKFYDWTNWKTVTAS